MEATPSPATTKNLRKILRSMLHLLQKSVFKTRSLLDLQLFMMKHSKMATKVLNKLTFKHNHNGSTFSNQPEFPYPSVASGEYEFSCSNSPTHPSYFPFHVTRMHKNHHCHSYKVTNDELETVSAVEHIFQILNNKITEEPQSPEQHRRGSVVRQVRVTDSPFPLRDSDSRGNQIDIEAEEFIKRFHEQLQLQRNMSMLDDQN